MDTSVRSSDIYLYFQNIFEIFFIFLNLYLYYLDTIKRHNPSLKEGVKEG